MAVSVAAVMRHINNFFEVGCITGGFVISGNAIVPAPDAPWCFVKGTCLHDGVYKVEGGKLVGFPDHLPDEESDGIVWLLNPPADFLDLCALISAYDDKNPVGAYMQESFGGYSYMRGQNGSMSWQKAFAAHLAPYRKMYTEVK